eukprot:TRINITY_DN15427_c0_g1_i2.p1 TRINITY_DN15427_c0_g1~~TRINITY_DN15427_c0_g1_i2.p1  ORF type:complete len:143 (-),score=15.98 TRINITY_DN15427_c0_g1_i2:377-805(-)
MGCGASSSSSQVVSIQGSAQPTQGTLSTPLAVVPEQIHQEGNPGSAPGQVQEDFSDLSPNRSAPEPHQNQRKCCRSTSNETQAPDPELRLVLIKIVEDAAKEFRMRQREEALHVKMEMDPRRCESERSDQSSGDGIGRVKTM